MKWSFFCGSGVAHAIKSEYNMLTRKAGVTFCGKDTTEAVDMWADEVAGVMYCGKCWRAYRKSVGKKFARTAKVNQRTKVEDFYA